MNQALRLKFDRIGRDHDVPDLVVSTEDEIPDAVTKHARPRLGSRFYDVCWNMDERRGLILCGMRTGGTFTITAEPAS